MFGGLAFSQVVPGGRAATEHRTREAEYRKMVIAI
jgi:hypothetical protein